MRRAGLVARVMAAVLRAGWVGVAGAKDPWRNGIIAYSAGPCGPVWLQD